MTTRLIDIGQALAIKANLDVPTTLIGNSERTARLILQSIIDGTTKDAFHDHDWAELRLEHEFGTVGGGWYDLPLDFDRIVNNTIWDTTNDIQIEGPVSADKWHSYYSGLSGLTGMTRICRLYGPVIKDTHWHIPENKRLRIYPDDFDTAVPNAAADPITVRLEYVTNRYIYNIAFFNAYTDHWTTDSDWSLIDAGVIEAAAYYRLLRSLGMSYADEFEEYKALVAERAANSAGAETLSLVQSSPIFGTNIPDTGYGG